MTPATPHQIDCHHCYDCGVCFVDIDGVEMLMRCRCRNGSDQLWALPKVGSQRTKQFPLHSFKPKNGIHGIWQMQEQWKAKIKVAEEFWQSQELEQDVRAREN